MEPACPHARERCKLSHAEQLERYGVANCFEEGALVDKHIMYGNNHHVSMYYANGVIYRKMEIISADDDFFINETYYDNGIKRYKTRYKNGKKHGMSVEYIRAGPMKRTPYVNGQKHGIEIVRDGDAMVGSIEYVRGTQHGEQKIFYPGTSQLRKVITWKNGQKQKAIWFKREGIIRKKRFYSPEGEKSAQVCWSF